MPINYSRLHGKLKTVYQNYSFTTHKLEKGYYRNPLYKAIVNTLYDAIPNYQLRNTYNQIIPTIEAMSEPELERLIRVSEMGLMPVLINVLKAAQNQ